MEPLECLKLDLPRPETIITEEEWERAKKEINAKMEIFDMECKMAHRKSYFQCKRFIRLW